MLFIIVYVMGKVESRALCTMPDFQGQSWNKLTLPGHCIQCPNRFGHSRLNIEYYIKKKLKIKTLKINKVAQL